MDADVRRTMALVGADSIEALGSDLVDLVTSTSSATR
jgi:isopentenyl diphosphate isomerase/L-lactate dehydrogenase-like FMN-dependent dehydrogenase